MKRESHIQLTEDELGKVRTSCFTIPLEVRAIDLALTTNSMIFIQKETSRDIIIYVYRCVQKKEPSAFYKEFPIQKKKKKNVPRNGKPNYQINAAQNYLWFA